MEALHVAAETISHEDNAEEVASERMKRFIKEQLLRRKGTENWQDAAALTGVIICLERPLIGNPAEYGKGKVNQREPFLHHPKAFYLALSPSARGFSSSPDMFSLVTGRPTDS